MLIIKNFKEAEEVKPFEILQKEEQNWQSQ